MTNKIDPMYHKARAIKLESGAVVFLDTREKRIGTYDPQVEGSLQETYVRLQIAEEHGTLTSGKYEQLINKLRNEAHKNEENLRLLPEDRKRLNRYSILLRKIKEAA